MQVIYTAPNRAHHYRYAAALQAAGSLCAFVSGYPRISPRAKAPELNGKLHHADILQTVYLASLRAGMPLKISNWLAYKSKIEQDFACRKFLKGADIFLFYNGSGLNTCRYARKKGITIVVEAVNTHVEYQEEILEKEYRELNLPWTPFPVYEKERRLREYELADYILLPSEFVKQSFIQKGFPAGKLLKVPYGFDRQLHTKPESNSKDKDNFTVLYVGSISIRKGIRYLIQAFQKLQHPNKKLIMVGPDVNDGSLSNLELTPDILFMGVLKGQQLIDAYHAAQVFCLPSIEDGLGLVLGEALSVALPIVATCNTGADDLITDGVEGFIVPIKDPHAIYQKLQLLANNPGLLEEMSLNAYAKANRLNGWAESGRMLVETLEQLHLRHSPKKPLFS